jgi:hypothetical protein
MPFSSAGRAQGRPQCLPEPGRCREAATEQLYHDSQCLGHLGIGRGGRDLVLPKLDITASQSVEIGRLGHGRTIPRSDVVAIAPAIAPMLHSIIVAMLRSIAAQEHREKIVDECQNAD